MWIFVVTASAATFDPSSFAPIAVGPLATVNDVVIDGDEVTWCEDDQPCLSGVLVDNVAVFTFDALTLGDKVEVFGERAVAILSRGELTTEKVYAYAGAGSVRSGPLVGTGRSGGGNGTAGESEDGMGGEASGNPFALLEGGGHGGGGDLAGFGGGALYLGALGSLIVGGDIEVRGGNGFRDALGGGAGGSLVLVSAGDSGCASSSVDLDVKGGFGDARCLQGDPYACQEWEYGGDGGDGVIVSVGFDLSNCDVAGNPRVDVDLDGDGLPGIADCDDLNPDLGGPEIYCDGVDQDCDPGTADDADADGDQWFVCDGDCDDSNPLVNPSSPDPVGDGVDQNCDGVDGEAELPGETTNTGTPTTGTTEDSAQTDTTLDVPSQTYPSSDDDGLSGALACGCSQTEVSWAPLWAFARRRIQSSF